MSTSAVPNPGSDAAVAIGCKCPVMDNARGRGIGAGAFFWISVECPVHCGNADRGDCASSAQPTGVSDKVPGRRKY